MERFHNTMWKSAWKAKEHTSSTAKGGGGSFKNRKPIGEFGCCESRMAERIHWWTERWLRFPLFLSVSFSLFLCLSLIIYLPNDLSIYLSLSLSTIYLSISLSLSLDLSLSLNYLSIYLSVCLSVYLPVCLSIYLPVYLQAWKRRYSARRPQVLNLTTSKTQQFCETSSMFEVDNVKNAAILRDFLNVWSWHRQKRSISATLPHFSKLTTSKAKQFCETSFKNGKLSAQLTASYPCVLRFFQSTCLNYCACHEKVMPGHTKCCTCHARSSQQTWGSDAPKCNPSQEISARTS